MENVSRRGFVAGAAALGATSVVAPVANTANVAVAEEAERTAASAGTGVSPLDPSDQWYFDFSTLPPLDEATDEVDVVVIGAGFGGHAAAITSAEEGMSVIQLEALSAVGGTSVATEGTFFCNCKMILDAGMGVDEQWKKDLIQEKLEFSHYRADRDCIEALIEGGAELGDWMCDMGVPFQPLNGIDALGRTEDYTVGLAYDPLGVAAIDVMAARAQEVGVDVRTNNKALHLYLEDGVVKGVRVAGPDGEYSIKAKAVILACGGYGDDPVLMKQKTGFDPTRIIYTGAKGAGTGDGIRMAYECGGEQNACACPGFVWPAIKDVPIHEQCSVAACNEFQMWVNQSGKRFVGEDILYDITACCNVILGQKHVWSIVPQNEVDRLSTEPCTMGWGSYVYPGSVMEKLQESMDEYTSTGSVQAGKCETLEDVAAFIDADPQVLAETVASYNAMCAAGEDTEFGKDPALMHPLETGPYYVFELYTNAPTTLGGIRINAKCEVLDANFDPIPGLYSASADNSGLSGDTYHNNPGGLTSGMALSCGHRAPSAVKEYIATL